MALVDMKSDLAKGVGSKQTPQSFQDGHSATTVTGAKTFPIPPRTQIESKVFTALSRQGEELKFQFNTTFVTPSLFKTTVPKLQDYYDRAFKNSDPLGARNNDRLGFDEPFILKGIGDRWGPGGLGKLDLGLVRAGAVTQAARTVADVIRIGKFLLTPRGLGFALKQDILQKMNAGGEFGFGTLGAMLGQKLGKPVTLNAKQQRFSTGRDILGSTPPTVDEMKGSDIRTWRPTSLIDSLPIGAHYVRHKVPAGSPSVQLVKNIGNFLVDSGDGVLKFIDGIDVGFPHISMNPDFKAGDILTGVGKAIKGAANGVADIFPNISGAFKIKKPSIKIGSPNITKSSLGRMDSFTTLFPGLIKIPTIAAPDFSALKNILGGLASAAASLISSIPMPGIKLPNISLPKLPNMKLPKLPKINLPDINIGNPFKALSSAGKGLNLNFPKFSGFGGLSLGNISMPDLSGVFPSIRLNADISKGSLSFNMAAFDEGKASFQAGLKNLLTQPDALNAVGDKAFGEGANRPEWNNNGERYGIYVNEWGANLAYKNEGLSSVTTPELYYTTANPSVAQDSKGGLRNLYDGSETGKYSVVLKTKYGDDTTASQQLMGINIDDDTFDSIPFAIASGFVSGQRNGVNSGETDGYLNTEKRVSEDPVLPKFPANVVQKSGDTAGRLQKYEMSSYGQLHHDESFSEINKGTDANTTRGIGHQGGPSRTAVDNDGNVIQVTAGAGYKNEKSDIVNLHPYGGSLGSDRINDTEIDFIPFKFRDMVNGKWIIFRAILESISDTSSPEYGEESYIGRPDKVYVYKGSTRNFNVTFKVMPKSVQELITIWEKLNYLRGLTYPTIKSNRMIAPFASVTVGDMVDKLPVLLQSLNYSVDTASTWEIKPGLRLPKLIQISTDMRVIEPQLPTSTSKHYDLDWLSADANPNSPNIGTFTNDPSMIASVVPDRIKYNDLWSELSGDMVSDDVFGKLLDLEFGIKTQEALIDELKSDIDVPNFDIPKVPGSFL